MSYLFIGGAVAFLIARIQYLPEGYFCDSNAECACDNIDAVFYGEFSQKQCN